MRMSGADLIPVARYLYPWEAHIARGRLEADGVLAFVTDDETIRMNWGYAQALGGIRVLVPRSQLDDARRILSDVAAGLYADAGEPETDDMLRCPRCSATRIRTGRSALTLTLMLVAAFDALPLPLPKQHHCLDCGHRWPA